ncbi:hypothetical protein QBC33DRAFT_209581 [Phialemonium atrogriseum]|uniref:Uncharacterized protein n=1 Tax=Phialemonium atrogriseum TaxID=1093897 RepID=A0AAJ0BUC5_9PEZI|nr:uncharacterized protein QBC33DRAFT_209581 [Phialemonium atrogriseum]KAK1764162.1 hypothetical protein QBC33DRAFT_209581 [Phialemonium atrogriseum]
MPSVRSLLSNFRLSSGKMLAKNELDCILAWIAQKSDKLDFTSFAGTYHCETVMFSLQLLARDRVNMTTTSAAERGVLLPDKEVVNEFVKDITILPVTKRCCPACHILLNYVSDLTLKAIRYPGSHPHWSSCSLPPWITKDAGEHMLRQASDVLQHRLMRIPELVRKEQS